MSADVSFIQEEAGFNIAAPCMSQNTEFLSSL